MTGNCTRLNLCGSGISGLYRTVAELRSRVPRRQARTVTKAELFTQRAFGIRLFVAAPGLQLGHHQVGKVDVGARRDGLARVEAVDVGRIHPGLHLIGDLGGCRYRHRAQTASGLVIGEFAHSQHSAWV